MYPLQNNTRISAALGWDSLDILCIEYRIPLSFVLKHLPGTGDTMKAISVGFVFGNNAVRTFREDLWR